MENFKMTQALIDYIQQHMKFNEEELSFITSYFQPQTCAKNSLLEKEDQVAKHLYFIVEGFVRTSSVEDCNEVTTHITGKNNFITAFDSFLNGGRSEVNVQCITNCRILSLTKENYKQLHLRSISWRTFCKTIYEKELQAANQRTKHLLVLSAEQRYLNLLSQHPEIAQNVPVQYIATYLGIKPESLSRIRRKIIS